jgi:hypothetical protein
MRIAGQAWVDTSADLTVLAQALAPLPSRWGRYAPLVRAGWLAVGTVLRDAQKERDVPPLRTGILSCGVNGSLAANQRYFKDYAESGRTLGRSSLFVYTLPTTPIAEYAIHFGLGGPLFYAGFEHGQIKDACALAEPFLVSGETDRMIVLLEDGCSVLGLALEAGESEPLGWMSKLIEGLSEHGKDISA